MLPDVFVAPIEPLFLAYEGCVCNFGGPGDERVNRRVVTRLACYEAIFQGAGHARVICDPTPYLSPRPAVCDTITARAPQARLIVMLRQPAERAYANFLHQRRAGFEPLADFRQALAAEGDRARNNWSGFWNYRERGRYHAMLAPYFARFPRTQIKVLLYEDWMRAPRAVFRALQDFLELDGQLTTVQTGLDEVAFPVSARANRWVEVSRVKRVMRRVLPQGVKRRLSAPGPHMPADLQRQLTDEYTADILRLQDLVERDLSHWLKDGS
jgi:Sulfotransferase family